MKAKLAAKALAFFFVGAAMVALLLFLPAGTISYPGAWRLMGLLFIPMALMGVALLFFAPDVLKKRLNSKEKLGTQKRVVGLSGVVFLLGFVLAGLDFRFGLSPVPGWLIAIASVIFLVSYGMYGEVMRENAWISRTVEIQEGQKVVSTGLYGVVRHPMYAVTLWLFLAIPVVLRILDEEKLLTAELKGYADYTKKVKYRLLPLIW